MKYFQSLCKSIGNYACYLLCLINIAEEFLGTEIDKLTAIEMAIKNKYVDFDERNYDDVNNFYVNNPCAILKMLTNQNWRIRVEPSDYKKSKDEYIVELWSTNGKSGHFTRLNKNFNSLQNSNCVNNGKIISYRVFNII